MSDGLLPFEVATVEGPLEMTGRAGATLLIETWRALGMRKVTRQKLLVRKREAGYAEADKLEALLGLVGTGGDCLDDVEVLRADGGLCRLWGGRPPSPDALLGFLYRFHW